MPNKTESFLTPRRRLTSTGVMCPFLINNKGFKQNITSKEYLRKIAPKMYAFKTIKENSRSQPLVSHLDLEQITERPSMRAVTEGTLFKKRRFVNKDSLNI